MGTKVNPAGQLQDADKVVIPIPVKKTNVPRKGKRAPMNPAKG